MILSKCLNNLDLNDLSIVLSVAYFSNSQFLFEKILEKLISDSTEEIIFAKIRCILQEKYYNDFLHHIQNNKAKNFSFYRILNINENSLKLLNHPNISIRNEGQLLSVFNKIQKFSKMLKEKIFICNSSYNEDFNNIYNFNKNENSNTPITINYDNYGK